MTRVALRCDAGRQVGVGHLARCVALAEELRSRSVEVELFGDLGGVTWAHDQLTSRDLPLRPAPDDLSRVGADAVVLDGYHLAAGTGAGLRRAGVRVLSIVDGPFGDQEADLVLDQNLGSELLPPPATGRFLAGVRYCLLRDDVRRRRPAAPVVREAPVPRVLCFFGGTDAYGAAPAVLPHLIATGLPFDATVVAAGAATAQRLQALALRPGQSLRVVGPLDDLAAEVVASDLVVSAAGTSTWELCCLGAPTALLAVTDNQEIGYLRTLQLGVAAGLGRLGDLAEATPALTELLGSASRRRELATTAWSAVDGRGRERVADALLDGIGG